MAEGEFAEFVDGVLGGGGRVKGDEGVLQPIPILAIGQKAKVQDFAASQAGFAHGFARTRPRNVLGGNEGKGETIERS